MPYKSESTAGDAEIVLEAETPIGRKVTLDRDTLEDKTTQHGAAWVNLEQARKVFEDPSDVFVSQYEWAGDEVLMFYRPADITTPQVKYVRGIADFRYGDPGRVTSLHPRRSVGNTGKRVYPIVDTETTDADG